MIVKAFLSQVTNDKDYKVVLKKRIGFMYILLFLGLVTLLFGFLFSFGDKPHLSDFLSGVYAGVGTVLIVSAIGLIFRIKRTLKDEVKIKQERIKEQDERNQTIIQKSIYSAGIVSMILMYIALMIAGIFNIVVFWTLWVLVMGNAIVYSVMYLYYSKKM
ncbi:hypothetical protein [Anaeromicropila herbilytica]|uniref:Uncharacterized protein n=1 Tax=Anaeromicropila herbilytica TaxID=2785025 RepID=A0A7R7EH56_9FIRM|nr:hypothetical protein [Anaeromicropila herbilytica]BCN29140.1 hypothetical protein bsdtb5_04350 [Anaeromicropila herbilytica]